MFIVGGSASKALSVALAAEMGIKLAQIEIRQFPDGDRYVRILDDLKGEDVLLVQTTHPDEKLVELLLIQDALREMGVRRIITVIPYYGYARQDRLFRKGEAVSARAVARVIEMQSDAVVLVDVHSELLFDYFSIPVVHVSSMYEIGKFLKEQGVDVVVAPDKGAMNRARIAAEVVGCRWDYLEKVRIDGSNVRIAPKNLDVSGMRVAIVDDIISTGGTIATATEQMKSQGAESVIAVCTHGLFSGNAMERLRVCDAVYSCDTLESKRSSVSVAPAIAKELRSFLNSGD